MSRFFRIQFASHPALIAAIGLAFACTGAEAQPPPDAITEFNSYVGGVEARLANQHQSPSAFLANAASSAPQETRLRSGELFVERLTPSSTDTPGAMVHHWRATAFAPGASAAAFEQLMKNFAAYPQIFSPQVMTAVATAPQPDHLLATMRVRQRHGLTVVMDTAYDVTFARLDPRHCYSISRSTRIEEITSPGAASERALSPEEEHGFLWRQNTYWSCEERDGGLYMQVESVSLTRSIPTGLGWALRPFVESVPRESLEFTLRSTVNALRSSQRLAAQPAAPRAAE